MKDFLDVCRQAAVAGGRVISDLHNRIIPIEKGPKDVVTEADFESQETIRKILLDAFPDHGFIGEEEIPHQEGVAPPLSEVQEFTWIVDPLDGTLNYVHKLPGYAVSIALRRRRETVVATVYDPFLQECFCAAKGLGATMNDAPIRTSECRRIDKALMAASLPANVPRGSPEVLRFIEILHRSQAIRRLGSAALNLCYVAKGRLDGYWATCVKSWDVAAGQLIVEEAGGIITRLDGSEFDLDRPQFAASASEELQKELLAALQLAPSQSV